MRWLMLTIVVIAVPLAMFLRQHMRRDAPRRRIYDAETGITYAPVEEFTHGDNCAQPLRLGTTWTGFRNTIERSRLYGWMAVRGLGNPCPKHPGHFEQEHDLGAPGYRGFLQKTCLECWREFEHEHIEANGMDPHDKAVSDYLKKHPPVPLIDLIPPKGSSR